MMNFFKRRKTKSDGDLEDSSIGANLGERSVSEDELKDGASQEETYEPWTPDEGSVADPLMMKTPELDEVNREAIAKADSIEEQVAAALKTVYDPEIPVNIYEMGLVYNVDVSEQKNVAVQMTLTSPGCPVAEQMPGMVKHAVQSFVKGIGEVTVEIVWDPPLSPDKMSEVAKLELGFM